MFSIKHVALDFWRWVRFNPSLTAGQHQQIIEVECQREYEGKGAFPNYVGQGIIDGFSEFGDSAIGLRHVVSHPLVVGLWVWASGGGWHGPHVGQQTLWPRLNSMVVVEWYLAATRDLGRDVETTPPAEEAIFLAHCQREVCPKDETACRVLHNISLLSQDAVLATRYVSAYDGWLPGEPCGTVSCMPTNNWLRDDRLMGLQWLGRQQGGFGNPGVIYWLHNRSLEDTALREKALAVELWDEIKSLAQQLPASCSVHDEVRIGADYGHDLAAIVRWGWQAMIWGYRGDRSGGHYNHTALTTAIHNYDAAWAAYNRTVKMPGAASPFCDCYESFKGGTDYAPGLGASVDAYRNETR